MYITAHTQASKSNNAILFFPPKCDREPSVQTASFVVHANVLPQLPLSAQGVIVSLVGGGGLRDGVLVG
jgi:hypothetical protein